MQRAVCNVQSSQYALCIVSHGQGVEYCRGAVGCAECKLRRVWGTRGVDTLAAALCRGVSPAEGQLLRPPTPPHPRLEARPDECLLGLMSSIGLCRAPTRRAVPISQISMRPLFFPLTPTFPHALSPLNGGERAKPWGTAWQTRRHDPGQWSAGCASAGVGSWSAGCALGWAGPRPAVHVPAGRPTVRGVRLGWGGGPVRGVRVGAGSPLLMFAGCVVWPISRT